MADEERSTDAAANVNNSQWAGLTGWPLLEQFMNELDTVMVNGHNDDINTFLTFAGLFSAVLTGLLVISFALLQPDGTDNGNKKLDYISMALHQISMQLFNSTTPPFVPVPEDTTPSKPVRSSIWINSLWFLSLVLSMAASLLGMIAKQWLREFLSWTTMSGLSERQVLLRHIRYEAFLEWQVPAIIALIPVLLETSLIMFLIGLCILLGTLNDRIVFGLSTAAVAVLVMVTIAVTVLPVKYPRCPYKSPAGWAFLRGWQAVAFLWRRAARVARTLWPQARSPSPVIIIISTCPEASEWKDWRQRELDASTSNQQPTHGTDELPFITTPGGDIEMTHDMVTHSKDLLCALQWITDTSQNTRILQAAEECVLVYPQNWHPFSCLIMDLYVACELLNIDLCSVLGSGFQTAARRVSDASVQPLQPQVLRIHSELEVWKAQQKLGVPQSMIIIRIARSIARDLAASIGAGRSTTDIMSRHGRRAEYYLQAATALGIFLMRSAARSEQHTSAQLSSLVDQFAVIFNQLTSITSTSPFSPLCLPLYQSVQECGYWRDHELPEVDPLGFTCLALRFPLDDPAGWRKDECELFVRISHDALIEWLTVDGAVINLSGELLSPLFTRMQACANRCHQVEEWSCLDRWPFILASSFYRYDLPLDLFPRGLVDALAQCGDTAQAVGVSIDLEQLDLLAGLVEFFQKLSNGATREAARASLSADRDSPSHSRPIVLFPTINPLLALGQSTMFNPLSRTQVLSQSNRLTEEQRPYLPVDASSSFQNDSALASAVHDTVTTSSDCSDPPYVANSETTELSNIAVVPHWHISQAIEARQPSCHNAIRTSRAPLSSSLPLHNSPDPHNFVHSQAYIPLTPCDHPDTDSAQVEPFDASRITTLTSASGILKPPISTPSIDTEPVDENPTAFDNTSFTVSYPTTHSVSVVRVPADDFDLPGASRSSQIDQVHRASSTIADRGQSLTSQLGSPPVRPSDLLFTQDLTAAQNSEDIEMENLASDNINKGDAHESGA